MIKPLAVATGILSIGAILFGCVAAHAETGTASYYGRESCRVNRTHGCRTASGEPFQPHGHTCAKWDVPMHTRVRVTDLSTGRSTVCRVNDRGPARRLHRVIDLSLGAAADLGMGPGRRGLIHVSLEML